LKQFLSHYHDLDTFLQYA